MALKTADCYAGKYAYDQKNQYYRRWRLGNDSGHPSGRKKYPVDPLGAFPKYIAQMAKTRENKKFLPGFKIPSSVRLTSDIDEAVLFGDLIVLSVPSEYLIGYIKKNSQHLVSRESICQCRQRHPSAVFSTHVGDNSRTSSPCAFSGIVRADDCR